ncbi:Piso0_005893 [Millerozyma farinosa CBS 7064]|uniref:Piso0_005893 protein n=1 Tax=Pichia sorbitophila (strain ATCC MYA-4447 / BCRC 22081 / CBS 7064 / NBRC 10061 / NRRL Y-12695) TaxID=559304 RepID=G8Y085_PICSO|nr:Piso0_005893 [Millerozyma farinosa CBS 7064]
MAKRFNLPYTTQDLFPQILNSSSSPKSTAASIDGETTRSGSFSISSEERRSLSRETRTNIQNIKKMARRLFKPATLDFETAVWECFHLITNPKKMYRTHYYKQSNSKIGYTRDDPSFLILLTSFLIISAIAWGLAYSPNFWDICKLIIYMVMIDFYLVGVIISTISWFATNRLFNKTYKGVFGSSQYSLHYIEWSFCFDIHCNSFLIIWCLLYLLQFILLPLLTNEKSLLSLFLGNTLYFGAVGYYFVITFYGFSSLPFVNTASVNQTHSDPARLLQTIIIMRILPLLAILWFISLCLRFNVAHSMVNTYFN